MIKKTGVLLCLGLALSCATFRPDKETITTADVRDLINSINSGDPSLTRENLASPFLLDTEIILSEQEFRDFWVQWMEAGFSLPAAEIAEMRRINTEDYLSFGRSNELAVFFRKYIPPSAWFVDLHTESGNYIIIFSPGDTKLPLIHALKGPVL